MPSIATEVVPFKTNAGGQTDFWHDWENRFQFLEGGWGSGKTYIGARKLISAHVFNAFDASGQATFVPSAVVGPTYKAMDDIQLPQLKDALREMGLSYVWRDSDKELHIPYLGTRKEPSKLIFRTADKPETITGWEVGASWGDEAARWKEDRENPLYDPYMQLTGRVRHPRSNKRFLFFTYTNEGDHTRIYEEAHSDKPGHAAYTARTKDNMTDTIQEFYRVQLGLLNSLTAAQYLDGGALNLRGSKVYSIFDFVANRLPAGMPWDFTRPLVLTMDFNIAPGMHGLIGQRNAETDRAFVRQELFRPRMDLPSMMDEFRLYLGQVFGKSGPDGKFPFPHIEIYGDATGSSASAQTGEGCYHVVRRHMDELKIPYFMRVPAENPLVVDRVLAVNSTFKDMDGASHIFVDIERCPRLVEDFKFVRYNDKGQMDKSNQNYTHPSDALGYWLNYVRPVRVKAKPVTSRFSFGGGAGPSVFKSA